MWLVSSCMPFDLRCGCRGGDSLVPVEVTLQNVGKTPLVYEDSCPLPGSLVRLAGADIAFLTRPSCNADGQQWSVLVGAPPGSTPRRIVWSVLVGAPGYAVASGTY